MFVIREKQKRRPTVTPDQLLHFSKRKRVTSRTVKEELLQKVTTKAFNQILNDKDGFIRQMQENIAIAIMAADTMNPDGIQARLDELQDFIRKQQTDITEFDESLVRKLIQQITVYDDHFTVEFKSGITINIEA